MKVAFLYIILTFLIASCTSTNKSDLFEKAKSKSENSEYKEAIKYLDKLIKHHPDFDSAFVERAYVNHWLGNFNQALADANKAIELNRKNNYAFLVRAWIYSDINKTENALRDLNHIILLQDSTYYVAALKEKVLIYEYKLHEHDKAISEATKIIDFDSNNVLSYKNRGILFLHSGQGDFNYEKAYNDFSKCIEIDSTFSEGYYLRSKAAYDNNNLQNALNDINKAISIEETAEYYTHQGLVYKSMNLFANALESFNRTLKIDPKYYIALSNRGKLKKYNMNDEAGGNKDIEEARRIEAEIIKNM
jgi:tetratricopeptide (TPR) repeat protein